MWNGKRGRFKPFCGPTVGAIKSETVIASFLMKEMSLQVNSVVDQEHRLMLSTLQLPKLEW